MASAGNVAGFAARAGASTPTAGANLALAPVSLAVQAVTALYRKAASLFSGSQTPSQSATVVCPYSVAAKRLRLERRQQLIDAAPAAAATSSNPASGDAILQAANRLKA